jgi:hypothetical protein
MSTWQKIWFLLGFISVELAYAAYPLLWEGAWYDLVAISFMAFTRVIYLQSKGNWSIACFTVWLFACNNLMDELFFDPTEMDYNEHVGFLLIILIVTIQRKKWTRK